MRRDPETVDNVQPCPTCRLPDGQFDTDYLREHGMCVTCGSAVIPWGEGGAGFCSRCKDHSANEHECPDCGTRYADWAEGVWEVQT